MLYLMELDKVIKANEIEGTYSLFLRVKKKMEEEGNDTWSHDYPNRDIFLEDLRNESLYLYLLNEKLIGSFALSNDLASYFFSDSSRNRTEEFLVEHHLPPRASYFLLERFMIDPSIQNKGYGGALLKKILISQKNKYCLVVAYKKNEKAVQFYLKHGFSNVGDCKGADWGIDGSSCYLFMKRYEER